MDFRRQQAGGPAGGEWPSARKMLQDRANSLAGGVGYWPSGLPPDSPTKHRQSSANSRRICEIRPGVSRCLRAALLVASPIARALAMRRFCRGKAADQLCKVDPACRQFGGRAAAILDEHLFPTRIAIESIQTLDLETMAAPACWGHDIIDVAAHADPSARSDIERRRIVASGVG